MTSQMKIVSNQLVLFLTLLFISGSLFAKQHSKVYINQLIDGEPRQIAAQSLLTQAYYKLGIKSHFHTVPGERGLLMTNQGQAGGELIRIGGLSAQYPNIIQVNQSGFVGG